MEPTAWRHGDQTILVDAGLGADPNLNLPRAGQLAARLEAAGIDLGSVTDVVLTHMHMDHIGGLLANGIKDRLRADLRIHLAAAEADFWESPDFTRTSMPAGFPDALRSTAKRFLNEYRSQLQPFEAEYVWGAEDARTDLTSLNDLQIDVPAGGQVPLREVAEIGIVPAPNEVKRENGSRRIDVTCDAKGRDLGSVASEIETAVNNLQFAQGYHPEFLGEYAELQASQRRLLLLGAMAMVGIVLILYVDFQSIRLTMLVCLTIPFALIGAVVAVWLEGGVLSLGSLVGFVTVLGIAARNGIMLVSHYRHLNVSEGMPFGMELVLRGAEERLSPIIMTVLTTSLALVPLIISGNKPGHEIEYPLAVVIVGGLFTSTILNLFLLPPLYLAWGGGESPTIEE